MYISLGFTMLLYVALAIGVFGTLTVEEVIANADTALAAAALPIFGAFGYTMISIAAVFATTGAINSQLYASIGATYTMAKEGHLPPVFGLKRRRREGGTQGLVISALLIIVLAVFFDVSAIASIGSAVALAIFVLVTVAHLRMTNETKASKPILYRGIGQRLPWPSYCSAGTPYKPRRKPLPSWWQPSSWPGLSRRYGEASASEK